MACDPTQLVTGARCIAQQIPPGMQWPVAISLLCEIAGFSGGGGGPCPPCDPLPFTSTPTTANFWRNTAAGSGGGGATMENVATITCNLTQIYDMNFMNAVALTAMVCPNLVECGSGFAPFGDFNLFNCQLLTSVSAPMLQTVLGNVRVSDCPLITSVAFPALVSVAQEVSFQASSALASVSLPLLHDVGTDAGQQINGQQTAVTVLNLPSLVTALGGFLWSNGQLVTFTAPNWVVTDGCTIDFRDNALSAASVNTILALAVAGGVTSCLIDLSAGTNSPPTGQGILDAAILVGAGNSVTTN